MAEDRIDTRDINWRHLLPWTELFRGFRVAVGISKVGLAAAGVLVMAVLWYVLAYVFFSFTSKPEWPEGYQDSRYGQYAEGPDRENAKWKDFLQERASWNLMWEAAGDGAREQTFEAGDLAVSVPEYNRVKEIAKALENNSEKEPDDSRVRGLLEHVKRKQKVTRDEIKQLADYLPARAEGGPDETRAKALIVNRHIEKPFGTLRTWPWFENRGPNPFLLVTGQAGVPWETGHFWDWLLTHQVPVLLEPLAKFLRPIVYFFSPRADWLSRIYFLLVVFATLATWALFGGAITRMAAVEVARNEKISPLEALRFVLRRYVWSYLLAPLLPLVLVAVLVIVLILFGVLHMIPGLGDILIDGVFWPVALILGLGIACLLVGLISWPLMTTTISTEDEEGLNAFARAYSYLLQAPWQYLWYSVVALAYGAVLVFFIGLMGSLTVYLAKWGVSKGSISSRDPSFLFVYSPTSFGWRELLLQGAAAEHGAAVVQEGEINPEAYHNYLGTLRWWNQAGAVLVSIWLGLFFLLILGFGYSYFWTASSIIYLLLRRKVDDAELDEVFFDEDEEEDLSVPPPAPPKPAAAASMVEAPSLRVPTPAPATAPAAAPEVAPPETRPPGGNSNAPPGGDKLP